MEGMGFGVETMVSPVQREVRAWGCFYFPPAHSDAHGTIHRQQEFTFVLKEGIWNHAFLSAMVVMP